LGLGHGGGGQQRQRACSPRGRQRPARLGCGRRRRQRRMAQPERDNGQGSGPRRPQRSRSGRRRVRRDGRRLTRPRGLAFAHEQPPGSKEAARTCSARAAATLPWTSSTARTTCSASEDMPSAKYTPRYRRVSTSPVPAVLPPAEVAEAVASDQMLSHQFWPACTGHGHGRAGLSWEAARQRSPGGQPASGVAGRRTRVLGLSSSSSSSSSSYRQTQQAQQLAWRPLSTSARASMASGST
jgi:hypothetical protein